MQGSKLNNVKKGEITVTIGSLSCIIYDVTDMAIMCGLTIPPDIMFDDKVAVKVLIDFSLTVKAVTLIFICGRCSASSSTKQEKSGSIIIW